MDEVKIVIPSHKRADAVHAKNVILNPIICVPESQRKEYDEHNPECEVVCHPDTVIGISLKRQWIYEHFKNVFMVDDDITGFYRLFGEPKCETPGRLDSKEAYEVVQMTADMCRQIGAYLFGFATVNDLRNYNPFDPLRLKGLVMGCGMGLLEGSKIYFHEQSTLSEDYFASLINAYYHRYAFIDERFGMAAKKTFHNAGGLSEIRTKEGEKENYFFLKKMFGESVQRRGNLHKRKATHEYQRVLNLPF